jgi:hypothetical protein
VDMHRAMAMNDGPCIKLRILDPQDFDEVEPPVYLPVPASVVDVRIELVQCLLTQWKQGEGLTPDKRVWDALAVSAAQMLSGLIGACAVYDHGSGARELVEQIDHFCTRRDVLDLDDSATRKRLEDLAALREQPRTADIVDALTTLHQERQKRRKEPTQQRAASRGGLLADTDNDGGWDV